MYYVKVIGTSCVYKCSTWLDAKLAIWAEQRLGNRISLKYIKRSDINVCNCNNSIINNISLSNIRCIDYRQN